MSAYPNRGARELAEGLAREKWTRQEGEERCGAASGQFSRLLKGPTLPGRALSIRIRDVLRVPVEAWDEPDVGTDEPHAPSGPGGEINDDDATLAAG